MAEGDNDTQMTADEARLYLGVSRRTFERYAKEGKFRKFEMFAPHRFYYLKSDLDALKTEPQAVRQPVRLPVMMEHFEQYLERRGYEPQSEFVSEVRYEAVPNEVATLLEVPPGTHAIRRVLRQSILDAGQHVNFRISDNFYNADLITASMFEGMKHDPTYNTMQALKDSHSKVVVRGKWEMIARKANEREISILHVTRDTPILQIIGANYAEDGMVVFVNRRYFIGDLAKVEFDAPVDFWKP